MTLADDGDADGCCIGTTESRLLRGRESGGGG